MVLLALYGIISHGIISNGIIGFSDIIRTIGRAIINGVYSIAFIAVAFVTVAFIGMLEVSLATMLLVIFSGGVTFADVPLAVGIISGVMLTWV